MNIQDGEGNLLSSSNDHLLRNISDLKRHKIYMTIVNVKCNSLKWPRQKHCKLVFLFLFVCFFVAVPNSCKFNLKFRSMDRTLNFVRRNKDCTLKMSSMNISCHKIPICVVFKEKQNVLLVQKLHFIRRSKTCVWKESLRIGERKRKRGGQTKRFREKKMTLTDGRQERNIRKRRRKRKQNKKRYKKRK